MHSPCDVFCLFFKRGSRRCTSAGVVARAVLNQVQASRLSSTQQYTAYCLDCMPDLGPTV